MCVECGGERAETGVSSRGWSTLWRSLWTACQGLRRGASGADLGRENICAVERNGVETGVLRSREMAAGVGGAEVGDATVRRVMAMGCGAGRQKW